VQPVAVHPLSPTFLTLNAHALLLALLIGLLLLVTTVPYQSALHLTLRLSATF